VSGGGGRGPPAPPADLPPGAVPPAPIDAALEAAERLLLASRDPAERAALEETVEALRAARASLPSAGSGLRLPPEADGGW
jgi:hypothetical protein